MPPWDLPEKNSWQATPACSDQGDVKVENDIGERVCHLVFGIDVPNLNLRIQIDYVE